MSGDEPKAERPQTAVPSVELISDLVAEPDETAPPSAEQDSTAMTAAAAKSEADAESDQSSRRFGQPGPPLGRSPFFVGLTGGLGLVLAYASFLAVRNALSILVLIFIALFLAIGLNPAVERLQRVGLPRGMAVATVGMGTLLLFCGGLFALVPPLISQTNELIENLPDAIEALKRSQTLRDMNDQYNLIDRLKSAATTDNLTTAVGGVWGGAQFVFGALFNVLTVFVLTMYFMSGFTRLKDGAYKLVPASRRERFRLIGDEILAKVGAYMVGALAIAIVAGTSTYIFLLICSVAYPFALAVVVAVCDLIPQIGATLGAVVVSVVGFATSVPIGIAAVIFFILYQQIENFLIYPKVMRRSVKVSDLAAIIAALLGVSLLGVVGALIAIPAVAAVQLIVREVFIPRQEVR